MDIGKRGNVNKKQLIDFANSIKELCVENGRLEHKAEFRETYIRELEAEVRKLKLEYPDSLLNRDKPLPVKWKKEGYIRYFCPKCGSSVANWYRYCNECGQKIADGNLLPENEIKGEEDEAD